MTMEGEVVVLMDYASEKYTRMQPGTPSRC